MEEASSFRRSYVEEEWFLSASSFRRSYVEEEWFRTHTGRVGLGLTKSIRAEQGYPPFALALGPNGSLTTTPPPPAASSPAAPATAVY